MNLICYAVAACIACIHPRVDGVTTTSASSPSALFASTSIPSLAPSAANGPPISDNQPGKAPHTDASPTSIFDGIILKILGVLGIVALIPLVLSAIVQIRDQLFDNGFISERSTWGRAAARAAKRRVEHILRAIGFTADQVTGLQRELMIRTAHQSCPTPADAPLSLQLVTELQPCIKILKGDYAYRGTGKHYVDTMGAMYYLRETRQDLARIMTTWIAQLVEKKLVEPPKVIIANKAGNLPLVQTIAKNLSPKGEIALICCKQENEKSRVPSIDDDDVHITDFEGLDYLIGNRDPSLALDENTLPAIILDDNCRGGGTLVRIADKFNRLLRENPHLPFRPVKDVVVLFTLESPDTRHRFSSHNLNLYSILHIPEREIASLLTGSISDSEIIRDKLKQGYGCATSLRERS